jgi:protein-disulfide isomerase
LRRGVQRRRIAALKTFTISRTILSVAGVLALTAGPPPSSARQADPLAARTKGSPNAPVTVYAMADFQCPACRSFALQTMPQLEREYVRTGKARFVFIHFPLTQIHPNAVAAAEVATCAGRQGRFWEMHDALFLRQDAWAPLADPARYLVALADSVGMDRQALTTCLSTSATRAEIEQDANRAVRSGARSTPAFYIEGGLLEGSGPVSWYRRLLDSIYRVKTAGR